MRTETNVISGGIKLGNHNQTLASRLSLAGGKIHQREDATCVLAPSGLMNAFRTYQTDCFLYRTEDAWSRPPLRGRFCLSLRQTVTCCVSNARRVIGSISRATDELAHDLLDLRA